MSGIYITEVMETQRRIVTENRRKQYDVKRNVVRVNAVTKSACITNQGISFEKVLSAVSNLWSDTKTTEGSTEYFLQCILALSSGILKDVSLQLGGNISDFTDLKKRIVVMDTAQRWVKRIIEEGEIICYEGRGQSEGERNHVAEG